MPQNVHFDYFDTVPYDFTGKGGNALVTDITKVITITDKNQSAYYNFYNILDGERPDQVSFKLYSDTKYYWMLFLMNDSLREGLYGWPLSNREFDLMIESEYDTKSFLSTKLEGDCVCDQLPLYEIPLNDEYLPGLLIYYKNDDSPVPTPVATGYKILRYDPNRVGIILDSTDASTVDKNTVFSGDDSESLYITHDDSAAGLAWAAHLEEEGYDTIPCTLGGYDSAALELGHLQELSYPLLKNATYQYFTPGTDQSDGEDVIVTHFDVLNDTEEILSPTRITFLDYEIITNNQKKTIRVPHPSIIDRLEKEYINLIQE